MITIKRFVVNFIQENCYILHDGTKECIIVDCGALFPEEHQEIKDYITENGLTPRHLLCTHGHFDHVFGVQFIFDTYGLRPEMSKDDEPTYTNARQQLLNFMNQDVPFTLPAPGPFIKEGDAIKFGNHEFIAIATPGHTPGGLCFYCKEEKILLSGDSLFRGDIGRCDLPGGNEQSLVTSLREKVLTLPEDVRVYPGHGPSSTIGYERSHNAYLK